MSYKNIEVTCGSCGHPTKRILSDFSSCWMYGRCEKCDEGVYYPKDSIFLKPEFQNK